MSKPDLIKQLVTQPVAWLDVQSADADVVLATRVALFRNLAGYHFPAKCAPEDRIAVLERVRGAVADIPQMQDGLGLEIGELQPLDRHILLERLLATRVLCQQQLGSAIFVSPDQEAVVMVNEHDHVRIQSMVAGLRLESAWNRVDSIESCLCDSLDYAYKPEIGFLTARYRQAGAGLHMGVILHLPALRLANQLEASMRSAKPLGFSARSLLNGTTELPGNLVVISVNSSLEQHQPDLIGDLTEFTLTMVSLERQARQLLLETDSQLIFDYVSRVFGAIRYSYQTDEEEALENLSAMRLGVSLGMITNTGLDRINNLLIQTRPAHLQKLSGQKLRRHGRDAVRALMMREAICG